MEKPPLAMYSVGFPLAYHVLSSFSVTHHTSRKSISLENCGHEFVVLN